MTIPELSIAIVDDDPIYQFTAKKIIQISKLAGDIQQFMSGDEALDYIVNNKNNFEKLPSLLLLDLNMPVMDGWMFLDSFHEIKSTICKEILIYIVTSSIDPRDIAHSKSYTEVKEFISKPLDIELVKQILSIENNFSK